MAMTYVHYIVTGIALVLENWRLLFAVSVSIISHCCELQSTAMSQFSQQAQVLVKLDLALADGFRATAYAN